MKAQAARIAQLEADNMALKSALYKLHAHAEQQQALSGENADVDALSQSIVGEFQARVQSEAEHDMLATKYATAVAQIKDLGRLQMELEVEFSAALEAVASASGEARVEALADAQSRLAAARTEAASRRVAMRLARQEAVLLEADGQSGSKQMAAVEAGALLEAREAQLSEYQEEAGQAQAHIAILQSNVKALKRQLEASERRSVATNAMIEMLQTQLAERDVELAAAHSATKSSDTAAPDVVTKLRARVSELEAMLVSKNVAIRQLTAAAAPAAAAALSMVAGPEPGEMECGDACEGVHDENTETRPSSPQADAAVDPSTAVLISHALEPALLSPDPHAELRRRLRERRAFSDSDSDSDSDSEYSDGDETFVSPAFRYLMQDCVSLLESRYEFGERLAANEDNAVFRARHRATGAEVAVKILDEVEPGAQVKEVVCLQQVQGHRNVQRLIEHVPLPQQRCMAIVTEYIADGPVDVRDPSAVQGYLHDLLSAVAHCHSRSIMNRDIKPANVMYDPQARRVVLIDFDCATRFSASRLPRSRVGTDGFFAPEIDKSHKTHGRRRYGPAVDIWCVGMTFGNILFRGLIEGRSTLYYKDLTRILTEIDSWGPEHQLLMAMLELSPAKRITAPAALAHPYFAGFDAKHP
ncbi:CMGC/CDK protein kinase [Thecamonas trahens ATCC 50062]|uniref:CMGC/CDK protein kinase n=1 Tax=Thecamonas trahens ATCC 50062 TaxID=461836 RepID=A0A0L0DEN2_THETB|nr:CMGC/CDK protein kinase [Thecamonas trahens ATCC 50062]KNC50591.1 CMGC/CDK protein kinase [Thecamonas trahens ATCC 50062]|eukprot:XP_013762478.1 CMGC/CDK protein kinase [Thecamonas trahens ATCC 50062]